MMSLYCSLLSLALWTGCILVPVVAVGNTSLIGGSIWSARDNVSFSASYQPLPTRHSHNMTYTTGQAWVDWRKFKSFGVNLGGWLVQEKVMDEQWWNSLAPNATDEWTLCETLGPRCGPTLEDRYATWITTADIDRIAASGVNTLRIPTTYSAWVDVPGSKLYHGNQQKYLKNVTDYAIKTHGMHIIVGLHSLPGGVNALAIGEAEGHKEWYGNEANLEWSYKAVDEVLKWIQATGNMPHFTFYPINEPSNHPQNFAGASGLDSTGLNWLHKYFLRCLEKVQQVDKRIPLMVQDGFQGEPFWSPLFPANANIVFDTHVYFFASPNATFENVPDAICKQVPHASGDGRFPVYIGEYSLESNVNNTLSGRKAIFDTWLHVSTKHMQGTALWAWKFTTESEVQGEGVLKNYWSFEDLLDDGIIGKQVTSSYC